MNSTKHIFFLTFLMGVVVSVQAAADGSLDTTFNPGGTPPGTVTTSFGVGTSIDEGNAVLVQDDGKIIVAGRSGTAGSFDFALVRYNTDGSLDTSFNGTGRVTQDMGNAADVAYGVALQSDGKIIVAGLGGTASDFAVARFTTAGVLDITFNAGLTGAAPTLAGTVKTNIGGTDTARGVAIQSDDKIVVVGDNGTDFVVARYTSSGVLDTSFGSGAGFVTTNIGATDIAYAVVLQGNGRIVVVGTNGSDFVVARYNTNGSLDTSFGSGVGFVTTDFSSGTDVAYAVAIQNDGKIVVSGSATFVGQIMFGLARYNTNGTLDTTFNGTGKVIQNITGGVADVAYGVAIQDDGKIVAAGTTGPAVGTGNLFAVARFLSNGALDTLTFGFPNGFVTTDFLGGTVDTGRALALQADGKIVVAGSVTISAGTNVDFGVARYFGEQVDSFVADSVICTDCGPIVLGNRGCARAFLYKIGDTVYEQDLYQTNAAFTITSINPSCLDFLTTVTVVCTGC